MAPCFSPNKACNWHCYGGILLSAAGEGWQLWPWHHWYKASANSHKHQQICGTYSKSKYMPCSQTRFHSMTPALKHHRTVKRFGLFAALHNCLSSVCHAPPPEVGSLRLAAHGAGWLATSGWQSHVPCARGASCPLHLALHALLSSAHIMLLTWGISEFPTMPTLLHGTHIFSTFCFYFLFCPFLDADTAAPPAAVLDSSMPAEAATYLPSLPYRQPLQQLPTPPSALTTHPTATTGMSWRALTPRRPVRTHRSCS